MPLATPHNAVTAAIADKIKHIHFQKESKYIFLPTISILPLCSQSAQLFQPLATRAEAWQAIPGVSAWVMTTVRRGYTLQLARRPPHFHSVLATTVRSEHTQVLGAEVMNLLEKGAIEKGATRCMDAALSPLRQMGIRILNYLDDWLILAQLQTVWTSHKTLLLSYLDCLGLRQSKYLPSSGLPVHSKLSRKFTQKEGCHDKRFQQGSGSAVRVQTDLGSGLHINYQEMLAVCQACQFFLPDIRGHHVLVRSDSRYMV